MLVGAGEVHSVFKTYVEKLMMYGALAIGTSKPTPPPFRTSSAVPYRSRPLPPCCLPSQSHEPIEA